jgi:hypothetical protein
MSNEKHPPEPALPLYHSGYESPPKKNQWSKGHSGNPAGRKRRQPSLQEMVKSAAAKSLTVKLANGETKSVPLAEALMENMLLRAANGDDQSMKQVIKWTEKYAPAPSPEPPRRGHYIRIYLTPEEIKAHKNRGTLPVNGPDNAHAYRVAVLRRAVKAFKKENMKGLKDHA